MKRVVLVSAAAALALCACAKKDEAAKASEGATAGSPVLAKKGPITPPERKAGLWEQKIATSGMTQVSRICFSDEVNKKMSLWGQRAGKTECSQQSVTPILGGWKISSTCNMGTSGTIVSEGEAKGDFGTHYVINMKSTTTGAAAAQMNGEHVIAIEATWKGPCPPDFKPGDMELGNGLKINILTMGMGGPGGGAAGGKTRAEQMEAMRKMIEAQDKAAR